MRILAKTVATNVDLYMANANLASAAHYTMSVATQLITVTCPLAAKENGVFVTKNYVRPSSNKEICQQWK